MRAWIEKKNKLISFILYSHAVSVNMIEDSLKGNSVVL